MEELAHIVNHTQHPNLLSTSFIESARQTLEKESVLTLPNFLQPSALSTIISEATHHQNLAYYTTHNTHNVYLTPQNPKFPDTHVYNRQVVSTKGCITTDQIPSDSHLHELYNHSAFREFLAKVFELEEIHAYADPLSSINIHYASSDQELGWHFDNSAFAITLLLQKPEKGGVFEYVPKIRNSDRGEMSFEKVEKVLSGSKDGVQVLDIQPGTLVLFRGRDSLHRVTKVQGEKTRMLVGLAYNEKPGVKLSEEARITFFGRTG